MSNKISKKATSATITKEELIKVILIFAACVLAAASLPYMMLGKNDGTIFLQWEIYLLLMTVMSIPLSQVLGNAKACFLSEKRLASYFLGL